MAATRRKVLVPLATLMVAGAVAVGAGASFTSTTASTTAVSSGNVTHVNDVTSLDITNIKDGDVITGSVPITNTGTIDSTLTLAETGSSSTFVDGDLDLRLTQDGETLYAGTFGELGEVLDLGALPVGDTATVVFTVTLTESTDNTNEGKSASASFQWVSTQVEGKWHRHILRGGSMTAATGLVQAQATAVLRLRMAELGQMVAQSDTRMQTDAEEEGPPFSIRVAEAGPRREGVDQASALVSDLGLAGDSHREGDSLARDLLAELSSSHHPITLLALSERLSESRGRVNTAVERMRSAGIAERAPMVDRIPQDVFAGLVRQYDARGDEWLMTRGGLGRLDEPVSKALVSGVKKGSLDIDKVRDILSPGPMDDQRVLLNTLGGRMPYGIRVSGADGDAVSSGVMRQADRALRRIRTVAQRLDEAL